MEVNNRRNQSSFYRTSYVDGNNVRKLSVLPDRREPAYAPIPRQQPLPERRKAPEKQERRAPRMVSGINPASMLVLTMAIIATFYFCVQYLMLRYDVTAIEKEIVSLERSLTTMKNENDAAYEQINSTYDLDYVYQVAVGELGMVYPNNNKVITYQSNDEGYVRQYRDIPSK
jgi:cell division protein FtsL